MTPAAFVRLDLNAAKHNLEQVKRYSPNQKIMAVIKANAYGHGMIRMAESLKDADAFAVARVDEGVRLRQSGVTQPILVLQGFVCQDELALLLTNHLDSVIHSFDQISVLQQYSAPTAQLSVWLKMDTGMNRLGFKPEDFSDVYQTLKAIDLIKQPINLITHFANADDLLDDQTRKQMELFNTSTDGFPGERSIANSAGIIGWSNVVSDWVRPGLMLYGCSPFAGKTGSDFGLKPVMSLHARLIAVKPLVPGESVGYAGTWTATTHTILGVVSIGYGDGYHRHTRSGAPVLVNGQRVPLIGRVSMDMIAVDLNTQPNARVGDPVTLWGDGLPIEEVAQFADTIPYTLLCGITQRVQVVEHTFIDLD